jgi:hypothetical protein
MSADNKALVLVMLLQVPLCILPGFLSYIWLIMHFK